MSENVNTEAFNRPFGSDVVTLVNMAMEAQWNVSTPRSVYELDAPNGLTARLVKQGDPGRPIGDQLIINSVAGRVARTVTANIEAVETKSLPLNLTELDAAPDLPETSIIREVHEKRRVLLEDGTQVQKSFTYEQMYYRAKQGSPDFKPHTSDTLTIIAPLDAVPQINGEPLTIEYAWDGHREDLVNIEPNAVLYRRYDKDPSWTKNYVYKDQNGRINMPEEDGYTSESGDYDVANIMVKDTSEQEKLGAIMMQVSMGDVDQSLVELVAKEVPRMKS